MPIHDVPTKNTTARAMINESYMKYRSEQLSWRPLQEVSFQISCADNSTLQRLEIRKMNLDRALLPGPLCAPLAYDPSFKGLCVLSFYYEVLARL